HGLPLRALGAANTGLFTAAGKGGAEDGRERSAPRLPAPPGPAGRDVVAGSRPAWAFQRTRPVDLGDCEKRMLRAAAPRTAKTRKWQSRSSSSFGRARPRPQHRHYTPASPKKQPNPAPKPKPAAKT